MADEDTAKILAALDALGANFQSQIDAMKKAVAGATETGPISTEEAADEEQGERWDQIYTLNAKEGYDQQATRNQIQFYDDLGEKRAQRHREAQLFYENQRRRDTLFANSVIAAFQATAHRDLAVANEWNNFGMSSVAQGENEENTAADTVAPGATPSSKP